MQIEDPAPGLKRLRDRRDLAALAALPWAAEAAHQVCGVRCRTAPPPWPPACSALRSRSVLTGPCALQPAPATVCSAAVPEIAHDCAWFALFRSSSEDFQHWQGVLFQADLE